MSLIHLMLKYSCILQTLQHSPILYTLIMCLLQIVWLLKVQALHYYLDSIRSLPIFELYRVLYIHKMTFSTDQTYLLTRDANFSLPALLRLNQNVKHQKKDSKMPFPGFIKIGKRVWIVKKQDWKSSGNANLMRSVVAKINPNISFAASNYVIFRAEVRYVKQRHKISLSILNEPEKNIPNELLNQKKHENTTMTDIFRSQIKSMTRNTIRMQDMCILSHEKGLQLLNKKAAQRKMFPEGEMKSKLPKLVKNSVVSALSSSFQRSQKNGDRDKDRNINRAKSADAQIDELAEARRKHPRSTGLSDILEQKSLIKTYQRKLQPILEREKIIHIAETNPKYGSWVRYIKNQLSRLHPSSRTESVQVLLHIMSFVIRSDRLRFMVPPSFPMTRHQGHPIRKLWEISNNDLDCVSYKFRVKRDMALIGFKIFHILSENNNYNDAIMKGKLYCYDKLDCSEYKTSETPVEEYEAMNHDATDVHIKLLPNNFEHTNSRNTASIQFDKPVILYNHKYYELKLPLKYAMGKKITKWHAFPFDAVNMSLVFEDYMDFRTIGFRSSFNWEIRPQIAMMTLSKMDIWNIIKNRYIKATGNPLQFWDGQTMKAWDEDAETMSYTELMDCWKRASFSVYLRRLASIN